MGKRGEYKKTIYNSRLSNVPMFYTSPSTSTFLSFATEIDENENKYVVFADEEVDKEIMLQSEPNDEAIERNDENVLDLL